MNLWISSHLLVVGLFLSTSAVTPEECQPLVRPLSLADHSTIYGRWNFITGYTDNEVYNTIGRLTESTWMNITPSPSNPNEVVISQEDKINGTCITSVVSVTIDGNTLSSSSMLMLPVEAECRTPTDHPWLGLPVAVPDKWRRQRKQGSRGRGPDFNIISEFYLLPSCDNCLLMSVNSTARNLDKLLQMMNFSSNVTGDEINARALYLNARESTLKDSDLEHFKKQASCLGFSREPDFLYDPQNEFCAEGEGVKMTSD